METIYEELDEAKAEIEKLKAEFRIKVELSESLKRAHNEQLVKFQEASAKVEKLTQELYVKEDEISSTKQLSEELKCNLKEKEVIIKQLSSANDKLRSTSGEKVQRYEEENRLLALALEEANTKNDDQEKQICLLKGEIEGLKESVVSVSQKKLSEKERTAKVSKELTQRDDILHRLEEEKRKFEDQLKWKKEQFNHLEEAHVKLRHQFKVKEKEWEKERDELLDEISKLQGNLDSQVRISEGLQNRLQMCNQALAHEESRRKYLEIQLSESKACFDNVLAEYEEASSKIEMITGQRDREIASLRDSLGTKETLYKEMAYQLRRLELENQELLLSLKEYQEARIQEAGTSQSSSKLQNKLRTLEKMHGECLTNLKAKEAEWRSHSEKLMEDLDISRSELECKNIATQELKKMEQVHAECATILENNEAKWQLQLESLLHDLSVCRSELDSRSTTIRELKREIEACDSLALQSALQNEETSLMFLVLRSEFSEAQLKLVDDCAGMDLKNKESSESLSILSKQLEMKNTALMKAHKDIEEEREKVVYFARKVESLNIVLEEQQPLQKELARQKEMLDESCTSRFQLEEQLLSMKRDLREVRDALERANEELAESFCEANEAEFELQIWKSIAERLKASLEENRKMRREVEASLLAETDIELNFKQERESLLHVIEEKDKTIGGLQEKLNILNNDRNAKSVCPIEAQNVKKKSTSEEIQNEMDWWEQEWVMKELEGAILAQVEAERNHEQEKESFHHLVQERDQRIDYLQQLVRSLEQEFKSSTSSFATSLSEMQVQVNLFGEAWEKITQIEVLKEIEIQCKNLMIAELESDLRDLQENAEKLEKSLLSSEMGREKLEADLEAKQLEVKSLTTKLEDMMNLSSEREHLLLNNMEGLCNRISILSGEDMHLMRTLAGMVQTFDTNKLETDLKMDEVFDPIKENMDLHPSQMTKKVAMNLDERSPLRNLNN